MYNLCLGGSLFESKYWLSEVRLLLNFNCVPETYILASSVPIFPHMSQSFLTKVTPVHLVTEVTEYA